MQWLSKNIKKANSKLRLFLLLYSGVQFVKLDQPYCRTYAIKQPVFSHDHKKFFSKFSLSFVSLMLSLFSILFSSNWYIGAHILSKLGLDLLYWWTYSIKVWNGPNILVDIHYRDRRVERQRRWPEALFRRLATLHLSEFFPLTDFP